MQIRLTSEDKRVSGKNTEKDDEMSIQTKKPRRTVVLEPEIDEALTAISALQGKPYGRVLREFLWAALPALQVTALALRKVKESKEEERFQMRVAVDGLLGSVLPQAEKVQNELSLFATAPPPKKRRRKVGSGD